MSILDRKKERLAAEREAQRPATGATEVVSATLQAFRERAKAEKARYEQATDSEYWVALCFHSRAEKEAFLDEFSLRACGDKYLDGEVVAQTLRSTRGPI